MSLDLYVENLFDVLHDLSESLNWLKRSFEQCKGIENIKECTNDEIDDIEAFMSRFSRTSDLLIQKVFRSIDSVEFEQPGTLLDVLNRAEKKGLIKDVTTLRDIRETRNLVSHEYAAANFAKLFFAVLSFTPELISSCEKALLYCERFKTV